VCPTGPLPAPAMEEFVRRITERVVDDVLAERVSAHVETLAAGKGEDFAKLRKELTEQIAAPSDTASKLTDEMLRLDDRAGELVERSSASRPSVSR
jgi:hypothetical protein